MLMVQQTRELGQLKSIFQGLEGNAKASAARIERLLIAQSLLYGARRSDQPDHHITRGR
jgi:hypothetical protein